MSDRNADLRNLLERWTNRQDPSRGVATTLDHQPTPLVGPPPGRQDPPAGHRPFPTTPTPPPPDPPPCAPPARGDVVSWCHNGGLQLGVVQNVGTDGRAWLRPLHYLDRRVPQPVDALTVVATRRQLTAHATHLMESR